ncbi:MAG TPA: carbon-nitrogen hydrolase family protein [Thermoguttaceae bacterium]|nr:carbon-nitrogen hydrolase family protein [Thermoguttaceae bacterium]
MSNTTIHLAMGQMLVEGGKPRENVGRAVEMIRRAAAEGCRIVVLPECLDLGWTHPSARQLAEPIPGGASDRLAQAARDAGIYVVAGLTERFEDRIFNAAVLIAPEGEILLVHRKINILDIAQDLYATGDRLSVAHTPLGTIGVNVCADNFPDSLCLGHALARMGAQVLLSPSAWAVDADHDPVAVPYGALWKGAYATLARLYEMPVVGVSNVGRITAGPWKGRKCIGCSLAIGPSGETLAEGPYGETAEALIAVQIEMPPRRVTGTEIAPMLRRRGYEGP